MEYEKGDGSPASVPEFGAIFMCNFATMKECHRQKLLGLPASQEEFVKQIKSGMILFLFEFEKRELYGVYQACSDGAMDIVPNAFRSSGKQFPAQVSFRVVWYCNPLSEHEFQDAISENYYTKKKFTFGLSDDQVRKLLCLFSSTKLETRVPRGQFVGPTMSTGKERILGNEKFSLRNRGDMFAEEDNPVHTSHIKYNDNSMNGSQRREDKQVAESSPGYDTLTEREWTALGRRKRLAGDGMNLMEGKSDFDYEAMSPGPVGNHKLRDRLYGARGQSKETQFLFRDTVETVDNGEAITSLRPGDFMAEARRGVVDDGVRTRESRGDKHMQSRAGFRFDPQAESFEILQTELRRPIDDQGFFIDRKVDYDYNSIGGPRLSSDDGQIYIDDRIECSRDNGISPIVSDRLDEGKRLAYVRRQISDEKCSSRLNYGGKLHYQESQTHADNEHGSITPDHAGYPPYRMYQSEYKHMLLKRGGVDNGYTAENSLGLPLSTEYADLYQLGQEPPFNSRDPMLEDHYSPSQIHHKPSSLFPHLGEHSVYGTSYPTSLSMEKNKYRVPYPSSHETVVTRSVPYDREFPEVNGISHSVEDFVPHIGRLGSNFSASIKASPYCMEDEDLSPKPHSAFLHASEVSMHDHQDLYDHYSHGGYRGKMEQPSIQIYDNPLPFLRNPIYDRRKVSPSIEYNEHAQDRVSHNFQENAKDSAFNDRQDLLMNYDIGYAHLRPENFENFDVKNFDVNPYQDADIGSKTKRPSVFSRLSKASRKRNIEDEDRMEDVILDQTVDQVMGTVIECLSQKTTDANTHSSLGKRYITEETLKRREKRFGQIEVDEPMITTRKMVTESKLNNTEEILKRRAKRFNLIEVDKPSVMTQKMVNGVRSATKGKKNEDVAKETRVVKFKRRSDTKKSQNGRNEKVSVEPVFEQEAQVSAQKPEATMEKNGDMAKEKLVVEIKCLSETSKSQNGELGEGIMEPALEEETQVSAHKPEGESKNDEDAAKEMRCLEFSGAMEKNVDVAQEKLVVEIKRHSETIKGQNGEKEEGIIEPALEQETQVSAQKPEGKRENDEDAAKGTRCLELNGTLEKNVEVAKEKLVVEIKRHSKTIKGQNGEKGEGLIEPALEQETQVFAQKAEEKRESDEDVAEETRDLEIKGPGETDESQYGVKRKGFIEPALEQKTEGSAQKLEGNMEVKRKQLKRRKLVRPVFDKKTNDNPKEDAYSKSQLAHERSQGNMMGSCDFADMSLRNSNFSSSNTPLQKRLIRPLFGKKEESNENSKRDQISGLQLSSSHDSPNNQKAATCEFSGKTLGNLNCPSPDSGSLVSSAPTGPGKSGVVMTNFKLRRNSF